MTRVTETLDAPVDAAFIQDVLIERGRQRGRWGDHHDDGHSTIERSGILLHEAGQATYQLHGRPGWDEVMNARDITKKALVKVAAVAMAWYQALDRVTDRDIEHRKGRGSANDPMFFPTHADMSESGR